MNGTWIHRLLAVVTSVALGLAACSDASPGDVGVHVREIYRFDTLPDMVIASDLVIEAQVVAAEPGRTVGAAGEDIRFKEVALTVGEVFWPASGEAPRELPESVPMEELGWDEGAATEPFPGFLPSAVGDHGYFFLQAKRGSGESGFYRLVNSQGRVLVGGNGIFVPGRGEADPMLEGFSGHTPAEFERELHDAVAQIQSGHVSPPPANPCCAPPGTED